MTRYAELAVTTNFSFLRGAAHPREMVARADELGLAAIGIADRNSFAGVVRAYDEAKKRSIKLLVGTRLVTTDGFEVIAYPTDRDAYGRLCRLLTQGNRKAKKGDCHLGFDDILATSEGQMLICLPPDDLAPRFTERLAALARAAPGRAFLAGAHRYRGDEPRRLGLLDDLGIDPGEMAGQAEKFRADGQTVMFVVIDGKAGGLVGVADPIKESTPEAIRQLHEDGILIVMMTGDSRTTANAVAAKLNIDEVVAEVLPNQKAEIVKRFQAEGHKVAMAGDGINDAPALEQADLGIAVSRASDIAREAADIILLKSEIAAVPESLGLARAALRTIKQNLFWAFFYNAIGIPLAALGFMSPVLCAAAMGLSDLVVIGNSLRLRRWRL